MPHPRPSVATQRAQRERRLQERAALTDAAPVLDAAARFLEARPRSVDETRRRLVRAGYPAVLVESVLDRLAAIGYLDDEAFARAWIESRDRAHPRGEAALRRELAVRGVPRDLVASALEERRRQATAGGDATAVWDGGAAAVGQSHASEPADPDAEAAWRVLERRSRVLLREPDPRKGRAKAYAMLARQGFDPDTCRTAVARWTQLAGDARLADASEAEDGPTA